MDQTILKSKCKHCKTSIERNVKTYEPELFSAKGSKSILSQFWCPKCGEVNAIRYEFYRDKQKNICARVIKTLEPVPFHVPKNVSRNITVRPKAGKGKRRG